MSLAEQGETHCLTVCQGNRKNTINGFLRKEKIMNEIITTNTKRNEILDGINTATASIYSSFVAESNYDKAKLYNALNSPEVRIADHIGKEINVKDVIIEPVEIVDEKQAKSVQRRA